MVSVYSKKCLNSASGPCWTHLKSLGSLKTYITENCPWHVWQTVASTRSLCWSYDWALDWGDDNVPELCQAYLLGIAAQGDWKLWGRARSRDKRRCCSPVPKGRNEAATLTCTMIQWLCKLHIAERMTFIALAGFMLQSAVPLWSLKGKARWRPIFTK